MSDDPLRELVLRHALEKAENLEVACQVRSKFDYVHKQVITRFSKQLASALEKALGNEWDIENQLTCEPSAMRHKELRVRASTWPGKCAIVLSADNAGPREIYIAWRWEPEGTLEGAGAELKSAIEKVYPQIKATDWGIWWYVESPYRSWHFDNPKALVEMYFQTEKTVAYFKEHMLRWVNIVSVPLRESLYH
jgi:hypothetical protein